VVGATVAVEGTGIAMATDSKGEFGFSNLKINDVLHVTNVGYQSIRVPIQGRTYVVIRLQTSVAILDETVVIGYGNTTRRFNTGSVTKVTAEEISEQPVSNPLQTLQGRVPGLVITSTSGLPGSSVNVQIRGQNFTTR
jgi:outer membrane receptor protein involved in Fe transport